MKTKAPLRSPWTAIGAVLGGISVTGFFVDTVDFVQAQKLLAAFLYQLLQAAGKMADSSLLGWLAGVAG